MSWTRRAFVRMAFAAVASGWLPDLLAPRLEWVEWEDGGPGVLTDAALQAALTDAYTGTLRMSYMVTSREGLAALREMLPGRFE